MSAIITEKPELTILYQDQYLVAIDKPAGLFVHRSFLDKDEKYFALQLLRDHLGQYVYPVHRLDKPTSGVLLFALSENVAREINSAFQEKRMHKTYYALTRGHLEGEGRVDHPIKIKLDKIGDKFVNKDQEAKDAITDYQSVATATLPIPLGKYSTVRYSLIKLSPQTGRRHQIRRHLAHLRHPIIGDVNYGDNKQNPFFYQHFGIKRLMLHAQSLSFIHPITNREVTIKASFDQQWEKVFHTLNWPQSLI
ncbi:tRNA pseudouridine(65) synthase TruC [Thalassotalea sp. 1_MG-2023]|uniref:tRNA pseudouridine(65) synthase TruC n=1 Tax=Thalassotalea sp. 1_MG-2023 TaxID=3062680 RepID=UPI0026E15D77|nr:tRNA pseudouridine(65) synthase TruC [Thalassotalea sp. 1_MG-2023]MDO6428329.1 tRNA pseudouridine(65) synthase TruC [Thalassotalea sp. 1_MG-2023]